jgi:hypothetical protein
VVPPCAVIKSGFHDEASVRLRVLSYVPDITPNGKPANVGVVVATPAVGIAAEGETQQWMCDAVVSPSKSSNDTWTRIVCAVVSTVTVASPVPGDAFVGNSAGPVRCVVNMIVSARLAGTGSINPATKVDKIELR